MKVAGLSDRGRVRRQNEDAWDIEGALGLWVLSDGMGGHAAGEVASRLAVRTVVEEWRRRGVGNEPWALLTALRETVRAAHRAVKEAALQPGQEGMGATLLVATVRNGYYYLAHVGDSRAYRLRGGRLERLTRDHTFVQHLVDQGALTPQQAASNAQRHILSQALGHGEVVVDLYRGRWEPSDVLLLCSDGLYDMVSEEEIEALLQRHAHEPERACQALVEAANRAGGEDNITVIVAVGEAFSPLEERREALPKGRSEGKKWGIVLGAALLLLLLGFWLWLRAGWVWVMEGSQPQVARGLPGWPMGQRRPLLAVEAKEIEELANLCQQGGTYQLFLSLRFPSEEAARSTFFYFLENLIERAGAMAAGPEDKGALRAKEIAARLSSLLRPLPPPSPPTT